MNDFASHLINRYGMDEVESWYFELWKDDRLNMMDEKDGILIVLRSGIMH